MATAAGAKKPVTAKKLPKLHTYAWEGVDKQRKPIKGEVSATDEDAAVRAVRTQNGATVKSIKKLRRMSKKIQGKDVAVFTRQLATMMKAGVPLLQSFDIVAKGHDNANVSQLLYEIKGDIEGGNNLSDSFRKFPKYFNDLYCNLLEAGEQAGILEAVLDRLALYQEKMLALRSKIKSAMMYPTTVIGAAVIITAVIMIFVIPSFKSVFSSFGAELPGPTVFVMNLSEFTVKWWYMIAGVLGGAVFLFAQAHERSEAVRNGVDKLLLRLPIFGVLIRKAIIARWTRTLATMFAAGVPLVESLNSVAGASGNYVYRSATKRIQTQVSGGTSLTTAMANASVFPPMVTQMVAIGEEAGSLDDMLSKVADHFEREVDDAVSALSSLMEPLIIVVLGTLVGGIVIAMYMPIFKLGSVV